MITTIDTKNASLEELVSTIIGGETAKAAEAMAAYGVDGREALCLATADWRDLVRAGLTRAKAIKLAAAVELGRRLSIAQAKKKMEDFGMPDAVANYFMERYKYEEQEHFAVAYLNVKNRLLAVREISVGETASTTADIKSIFRWAMRYNASGIIVVHNHPSGCTDPSGEDTALGHTLYEMGRIMDIELLDSIVVGDGSYYSYVEDYNFERIRRG